MGPNRANQHVNHDNKQHDNEQQDNKQQDNRSDPASDGAGAGRSPVPAPGGATSPRRGSSYVTHQ